MDAGREELDEEDDDVRDVCLERNSRSGRHGGFLRFDWHYGSLFMGLGNGELKTCFINGCGNLVHM